MTERADSLRNDIREQLQLTEMAKRRSSTSTCVPFGLRHRPASPPGSPWGGSTTPYGNDSSAGVEEPSTLVQRRCAPRTRPQD